MPDPRVPAFEDIGAGAALDRLPPAALDILPYGVVKLSTAGRVLFFSEREGELSGFLPEKALGQHWLVGVAPCMNNPAFRAQLCKAKSGPVDAYLTELHDFGNPQQALEVRIVSGGEPDTCWLLIRRV